MIHNTYQIDLINRLSHEEFTTKFGRICCSRTWVREMALRRPYLDPDQLSATAAHVWWHVCERADWVEAFNGRPLIGDMVSFEKDLWCAIEDELTIAASPEIGAELIACNKPYMEKFGFVWILLCEGLTPEQQLASYKRRIENDPDTELRENCVEDFKVSMRRLRLCLLDQDPYDAPPKPPITVGIIGAGVIGETFGNAFAANGRYRIVAVCDTDRLRAERLANAHQAEATTRVEDLLTNAAIELIYLGVPPKFHADIFCAAVAAGKHVLCEKPLCLTDAEAGRMVEAAERGARDGVVTAVNYPLQYVQGYQDFKKLVRSGFVGEVRQVSLRLYFPHWPRAWQPYQRTDWINRREQGGPLREIGSHFFFALTDAFGLKARQASALVRYPEASAIPGIAHDDTAELGVSGSLTLDDGTPVIVEILSDTPSLEEEIRLTVHGSQASIALVNFQSLWVARHGVPWRLYEEANEVAADQLMSSSPVVSALHEAIREKPHQRDAWKLVSIAAGAHVQNIITALHSSNGQTVAIGEPAPRGIRYVLAEGLTKPLPVFSHATVYDGLVHVSCIQGFLPGTFDFPSEEAGAQAEQAMQNLREALRAAGSDLSHVLKMMIFFVDLERDFAAVNAVLNKYFPERPPARSSIGVAQLPRKGRVVIECSARTIG